MSLTRERVDELEKIIGQLESLYEELSALSKKSPNDAVNKFKLRFINTSLDRCNAILGEKYRPFPDFQAFDPDELVTNSDAVLIVSLYMKSLEKFRSDNLKQEHGFWYYDMTGEKVRTAAPARIKD